MNPITPQAALENIVNAARQARLTYAEHATVDQCAKLLEAIISPPPTPPETTTNTETTES